MKLVRLFLISCIFCSTLAPSQAQVLYGDDLARTLLRPKHVRKITNIRARLRKTAKEADPLFILLPLPFDEIDTAPDVMGSMKVKPKSWDVPPWPAVDPALPEKVDKATAELIAARTQNTDVADVWSELEPQLTSASTPSVLLKPRAVAIKDQFTIRVTEIPPPFSLRRYFDQPDVFLQIACYGGTTSFKAEEAFRALKLAATRQQKLEGIGKNAFLTRIEITEAEDADADKLPFEGLEPIGEKRPELLDSAAATAMTAPAFQDLPVKDLEGRKFEYFDPNKRYKSDQPEVKQSILAIVAFFPDQALTVSITMEDRLGTVQDLLAISLMVQRRVLQEIKRKV